MSIVLAQSDFTVRKAVLSDLNAIKTLADAHKHELGFILRPALAESIVRSEVFVATSNASLIGFVEYHHRRDRQTTLYHIAVATKWQQSAVGTGLIEALQAEASVQGKQCILLKCPEDLSANIFYAKLGFELVTVENGQRRKLNVWRLNLP